MPLRVAASIWTLSSPAEPKSWVRRTGIPLIARRARSFNDRSDVPAGMARGHAASIRPRLAIETLAPRAPRPPMTEPHPTIRPQPGILDDRPLPGRRVEARRPRAGAEAQLEREPVRPVAAGGRGLPRRGGEPAPLPDHRPRRAARRHRRGARPRPGADHLRRGLGRDHRLPDPGLCRPGPRGHPHRARLRHVPHQRARRRRHAGRGAPSASAAPTSTPSSPPPPSAPRSSSSPTPTTPPGR